MAKRSFSGSDPAKVARGTRSGLVVIRVLQITAVLVGTELCSRFPFALGFLVPWPIWAFTLIVYLMSFLACSGCVPVGWR